MYQAKRKRKLKLVIGEKKPYSSFKGLFYNIKDRQRRTPYQTAYAQEGEGEGKVGVTQSSSARANQILTVSNIFLVSSCLG